jgi:hypothetical protein
MNTVLATLGGRLTDRLVSRLTGPGLLYAAMCLWAAAAGHRRAFDPGRVLDAVHLWEQAITANPLALGLVLALALLAATLAGMVAAALADGVVERVWTWPSPPAWWIERRGRIWDRRHEGRDPKPPSAYRPQRLTAIGDEFRLAGKRTEAQYRLSLPDAWPRLMILAGADTRTFVSDAYERYRTDNRLVAWALLTALWTVWWWPALLVAVVLVVLGHWRARQSARTLAVLIEAVVDTHQMQLAESVGVDLPSGRLTTREGPVINNILAKRR